MNSEPLFEVVTDSRQLEKHLHHLQTEKVFGIDTETTGLDALQDKLRLVQVATSGYTTIIFDMWSIDGETLGFLRELLSGPAVKVFQNAKFDMKFLHQAGLSIAGRVFDTYIAGHLLRQKTRLPKLGLDTLTQYYLSMDLPKHEQKSDWSGNLSAEQYEYAARDAAVLIPLREAMVRHLQAEDMVDVARLEFGCLRAVTEMELTGIQLHLDRWKQLGKQIEQQREEAAFALNHHLRKPSVQLSLFGQERDALNLDSQQQVLKALKGMGIPIKNTSKNQLLPLATEYPVVQLLLEYRRAAKALQAFIYSIPDTIHPVSGRLHPQYHQMGASTGRFSCGHPNLQQIPRSKEFRSCFVAKPEHKLVIADYSQIELRVVAEITRDKTMIEAYKTGEDLHRLTASLVANKALKDVTKQERQAAKAINFGLVYAMGARGLQAYAQTTYGVTMSLEEAELFRKRFFEAYAGVANWHKSAKASNTKVTRTLAGRTHRWKNDAGVAGLYNYPVQGTAADIVKQALVDLVDNLSSTSAKIVGMVHDEIILETHFDEAREIAKLLKETMEQAGSRYLRLVPVVADTMIADNWAEK
ncbi:bifunctional 3'-5' exonuclease/DNA polymerase [Alicyclobacillus curvatus]|nr:bifunctional 3'-5' exonuclease/DNA polymerase [Alicyclobacillus curvatus]